MSPKNFTVYADGAYSPINPYVGVGVVVIDNETSFVKKDSFTPGEGTNQAVSVIALFDVVRSELFEGLPGSASRVL